MSKQQLDVINLSHKYQSQNSDNYTLTSINLSIDAGEIVGLVGPSGCGKTTLLRLIAGFETPFKGQIFLNGREISSHKRVLPPEKRKIGMVFQDYALFPHLTLWKNVCFGLTKGSDKERIYWLLDLLGLRDFINRYPHQLSGGQRQRLALARALAPGNSLILLDEPFNSLDVQVRTKLRTELPEVLKTFSASGIFVTHDSQEALSICDRVAVMRNGQLHQCDSAETLINEPSTSFVGEFVFQRNIFPFCLNEGVLSTPLGNYLIAQTELKGEPDCLMFGSDSLTLDFQSTPNAVVKSREYQDTHWIITIKFKDYLLRVSHQIGQEINIGDSCCLTFKPDQKVFLFPGPIQITLGSLLKS